MPSFNVLISDPILQAAVLEQLKAWPEGIVTSCPSVADGADPDAIYVLDQGMVTDTNTERLGSLKQSHPVLVFLIGKAPEDESSLFTETFDLPLRLGHLLARIHFYHGLRQCRPKALTFGPYLLDTRHRQLVVTEDNTFIRLTEKETALLEYLGQSDRPVTRDELLAAIWGYDVSIETHTLETHLTQLRRKLDPGNSGANWLINEQGAYFLKRHSTS